MSDNLPKPQESEEVDLGQLFKLIGNMFDRFFRFIGSIFNKLFLAFVWVVFFLKKHTLKFVIAGVLGVGLGFLLERTSEPVYKSYITVKQNYDTGENLYNSISYYRDLVRQRDIATLSKVLGIGLEEVNTISGFEIKSVISENDKLKNFNNYTKKLDTTVAKIVDFETYLKNSKEYSHQIQKVTIKAAERNNFKKVFDKIVDNVNTNTYFKNEQQKDSLELIRRKEAIEKSLETSIALQEVYKDYLINNPNGTKDQIQATIRINNDKDKNVTKEFELYENDLELRRELVEIERELEDKKHIIEVISSKQDSGSVDNSKEIFGISISPKMYYAFILMCLTFIVLFGLQFIKFLERYKDKI